jgi:hypothetical protein
MGPGRQGECAVGVCDPRGEGEATTGQAEHRDAVAEHVDSQNPLARPLVSQNVSGVPDSPPTNARQRPS